MMAEICCTTKYKMTLLGINVHHLHNVAPLFRGLRLYKLVQLCTVWLMPINSPAIPAGVEINGGRLRELRKLRGETLTGFAARCDISFGYLGRIEREPNPRVSPPTFLRLCDALNLSEDERTKILSRKAQRRARAA
jgi:hypothetical protein